MVGMIVMVAMIVLKKLCLAPNLVIKKNYLAPFFFHLKIRGRNFAWLQTMLIG
jgi:hypothetical protein